MGRLISVSSHLPEPVDEASASPGIGGLADIVAAVHRARGGIWIGGSRAPDSGSAAALAARRARHEAERWRAVELSEAERVSQAQGFDAVALWPVLHYHLEGVRLDVRDEWASYRALNERFAEAVAGVWRDGDVVWIHDHPLMLVPELLRRALPRARIGFFLHAPFPASDVFRLLPWRDELLRGVLGADLIGFNAATYRSNFARAAAGILGVDFDLDALRWLGRSVHLDVFPVGVDAVALGAAAPTAERAVVELFGDQVPPRLVLGIDRLEPAKGLMRRLHAFERFLAADGARAQRVRLVQVVHPPSPGAPDEAALMAAVNELVGRINARHGSPSCAPIHLLSRLPSTYELVALYRAAQVMLVTPLRDGMNLVAKEFVAARTDERGVLVLSELAGAAEELHDALLVNPYDIYAMEAALAAALAMSEDEQRARMRLLRARVALHDLAGWHHDFVARLEALPLAPVRARPATAGQTLDQRMERLRAAPRRLILLDYDGTLVPFAPLPELAVPDRVLSRLLETLAAQPGTDVHVITGRSPASIERFLGQLPIGLHAEHGFWSRSKPGDPWEPRSATPALWREQVVGIMSAVATRCPGALVEPKTAGVAFHYRRTDPTLAAIRVAELRTRLQLLELHDLEILDGAKLLEARVAGVHKGLPARDLLAAAGEGVAVLAGGDDRTDDDLFSALGDDALTVSVGPRAALADYRVAEPAELRLLLARLIDPAVPGPRPRPASVAAGPPV